MPRTVPSEVRKDTTITIRLSFTDKHKLKTTAKDKKMTVTELVYLTIKPLLDNEK